MMMLMLVAAAMVLTCLPNVSLVHVRRHHHSHDIVGQGGVVLELGGDAGDRFFLGGCVQRVNVRGQGLVEALHKWVARHLLDEIQGIVAHGAINEWMTLSGPKHALHRIASASYCTRNRTVIAMYVTRKPQLQ